MLIFTYSLCENEDMMPGTSVGGNGATGDLKPEKKNNVLYREYVKHLVTWEHQVKVKAISKGNPLWDTKLKNNRYVVLGVAGVYILEAVMGLIHFRVVTDVECYLRYNCIVITVQHVDYYPYDAQLKRAHDMLNVRSLNGKLIKVIKIEGMTEEERASFKDGRMNAALLHENMDLMERAKRCKLPEGTDKKSELAQKFFDLQLVKLSAKKFCAVTDLHIFKGEMYRGDNMKEDYSKERDLLIASARNVKTVATLKEKGEPQATDALVDVGKNVRHDGANKSVDGIGGHHQTAVVEATDEQDKDHGNKVAKKQCEPENKKEDQGNEKEENSSQPLEEEEDFNYTSYIRFWDV